MTRRQKAARKAAIEGCPRAESTEDALTLLINFGPSKRKMSFTQLIKYHGVAVFLC